MERELFREGPAPFAPERGPELLDDRQIEMLNTLRNHGVRLTLEMKRRVENLTSGEACSGELPFDQGIWTVEYGDDGYEFSIDRTQRRLAA